jgi:hypothetical protein
MASLHADNFLGVSRLAIVWWQFLQKIFLVSDDLQTFGGSSCQ